MSLKTEHNKHEARLNKELDTYMYFKAKYKRNYSLFLVLALVVLIVLSSVGIGLICVSETVYFDLKIDKIIVPKINVTEEIVVRNNISSEAIEYLNEILAENR